MPLLRHPIVQYGYYVQDLEASVDRWTAMMGAGPFLMVRPDNAITQLYRGAPAREDVSHAFGQCGDIQIQLTQQHDDAPSIWRDMYPDGGEGLHHVAIIVDDMDAEVARFQAAGCSIGEQLTYGPLDDSGKFAGQIGRVTYMDARAHLFSFVEILERSLLVEAPFRFVRSQSDKWDGTGDPRRYLR